MTIYAISGAPNSGKTTLAKRLVGAENIWDLNTTRRSQPMRYLSILDTVISGVKEQSKIGVDGILEPKEVHFLRERFPQHEIVHYHISTGDETMEPNSYLTELAMISDYACSWRKANG